MIRQGKIWLAAGLLALGTAGCFDDPSSDLRDGATALNMDRTTLLLAPAESKAVLAYLQDAQGNTLPIAGITWESVDPSIATVAVDTENVTPGSSSSRAFITGVGGGATYVRATSGGFSDSVYVATIPTTFTGALSTASTTIGDTVTVSSTSLVTFDPAEVRVWVGGSETFVISATASAVSFIVPEAPAGTAITVGGLLFLGGIPLDPLDLSTTITVTDPNEPANDGLNAQNLAVQGTTSAAPLIVYGSVSDASDPEDLMVFTTSTTAGLRVSVLFLGNGDGGSAENPDIDAGVCNSGCTAFLGSAGTTANPEAFTIASLPAGTYHVYILGYDTGGKRAPYQVTIYQQ